MPARPLASVDLNLLVALDALLSERSVTRAGARLSLSQPATSHALARLRVLFDDELLVRSGRTMTLTGFAQALREPVRAVLAQIEQTLATRPAFDPATDERAFRVFANDYVTIVLLAPLLRALATEAPGVRLEVVSNFSSLRGLLHDDGLDLVIAAGEFPAAAELPGQTLFADRFVVAAGDGLAGELGPRLTRRQLAELPYLVYRQGGAQSHADLQLDALGVPRNPVVTVESFVLVPHLLRGTRMITMLQQRLIAALGQTGGTGLLHARPPVALAPITERMYWHPRAAGDPAHRWLRERLVAVATDLDA
jgi:LysR family nod box-dependent transcriptional activator